MNEYQKVTIDNVEHSAYICYENLENPVLLCVHGGPGQAETAYINEYQKELVKHFIVVRHDQRGAGLTGWKNVDAKSLTIEKCVSDTIEMTNFIKKKFHKEKVYILGHSWGSMIAILAVKNSPEYYHTYIGVSQVVDYAKAIHEGCRQMVAQAKSQNKKDVLKQLKTLGEPPFSKAEYSVYSRCVGKMSGFINTKPKSGIAKAVFTSKDYPTVKKITYFYNAMKTGKVIFQNGININLFDQVSEIKVPVTFISGKYDLITPLSLVEAFYQNLSAPKKQLLILDNSAHMPQLEEYTEFNKLIIRMQSQF